MWAVQPRFERELGAFLELTPTGVRQHLAILEREGFVVSRELRGLQPSLLEDLSGLGLRLRGDLCDLATFWERLVDVVSEEGLQIDPGTELRAVVGEPGGFFGRHTGATVEGRWREDPPDGLWCAYRPPLE